MKMKAKTLTTLALMIALTVILGLTPLGYIPIGAIEITLMCIPVVVGTLVLGLKPGLILGLAFGVTSLIKALTAPPALLVPLLDQPLVLYTSVFLPRLLIPLTTWLVYQACQKLKPALSIGISAAVGSLTNTVFFLGLIILLGADKVAEGFGMTVGAVIGTLATVGATNGLPEAAVAVIVTIPVVKALQRLNQ